MKFFKNTVAIVALFAIGSVFAKQTASRGGKATAQPTAQRRTPAPEMMKPSSTKTYSALLAEIKKMRPADVVDSAGNLTQNFIDKIMEEQLTSMETKALLQAGINVHATWTVNNQENKAKLSNLNLQVAKYTQQAQSLATVPQVTKETGAELQNMWQQSREQAKSQIPEQKQGQGLTETVRPSGSLLEKNLTTKQAVEQLQPGRLTRQPQAIRKQPTQQPSLLLQPTQQPSLLLQPTQQPTTQSGFAESQAKFLATVEPIAKEQQATPSSLKQSQKKVITPTTIPTIAKMPIVTEKPTVTTTANPPKEMSLATYIKAQLVNWKDRINTSFADRRPLDLQAQILDPILNDIQRNFQNTWASVIASELMQQLSEPGQAGESWNTNQKTNIERIINEKLRRISRGIIENPKITMTTNPSERMKLENEIHMTIVNWKSSIEEVFADKTKTLKQQIDELNLMLSGIRRDFKNEKPANIAIVLTAELTKPGQVGEKFDMEEKENLYQIIRDNIIINDKLRPISREINENPKITMTIDPSERIKERMNLEKGIRTTIAVRKKTIENVFADKTQNLQQKIDELNSMLSGIRRDFKNEKPANIAMVLTTELTQPGQVGEKFDMEEKRESLSDYTKKHTPYELLGIITTAIANLK